MDKDTLYQHYAMADCLIFPSRVETWGLPISEFSQTGKPMLLADLPYAHETSAGSKQVAFFNPEKPEELQVMMRRLIDGDSSFLKKVEKKSIKDPKAENWEELFKRLLDEGLAVNDEGLAVRG
jgi:glycosyltransferase involved in cell wall biosynthesis